MAAFNPMACAMPVQLIIVIGIFITAGISAAPTPEKCLEFYFYDHGTEHCEHCGDICDDASYKGTVDQCWKLCQPYALILWPPKPASSNPTKSGENEKTDNSGLPLGGQIAIPVVSILVLFSAVVGVLYIRRRRSNARKNQRAPPVRFCNQTAVNLLDQTALVLDDTAQSHDPSPDVSSSTAGIQEEGTGGSAEGSMRESRVTTVAQTCSSHQLYALPVGPRHPVAVSAEGNDASFAMALPRPVGRSQPPPPTQRPQSLADDDLDSTEMKTLLPSISDDSLLNEARGGTTITTTADVY